MHSTQMVVVGMLGHFRIPSRKDQKCPKIPAILIFPRTRHGTSALLIHSLITCLLYDTFATPQSPLLHDRFPVFRRCRLYGLEFATRLGTSAVLDEHAVHMLRIHKVRRSY